MNRTILPIPSKRVKDLTGQRFGRLLVLGYAGSTSAKQSRWLCRCDCGQETTVTRQLLTDGKTSSCGCFQRENSSLIHKKHGMKNTPEYRSWKAMRVRCNNPNIAQYKDYGGRGIKVCQRWNEFLDFLADMGRKPTPKHSLDRIDVNANYSCGHCNQCVQNGWSANCRWATRLQQNNNARSNRNFTYQGETLNVAQWARRSGISESLLYRRLVIRGWSAERALTTPVNKK